MRLPLSGSLLLIASLTACATFPELDATLSDEAKAADFPTLMPINELSAATPAPRITEQSTAALSGRVSALQARAARLRRSVVDAGTKQRMRTGVAPIDPE
ncbi:hypothetical protein KO498_03705 [Lentibacter algarum]|uniref:hypothetical protein n=1 Tax=Lentibacter algarum TaxID=576131 RepID=UPI001C07ACC5|nr:hypothetical protein [Lentibacter algarum]MBU2980912.1 hypothetical protein [Lentibacter algarum]